MRYTRTLIVTTAAVAIALGVWSLTATRPAEAHCQVPCGIYDDPARIQLLREDATTIEKAVASINELSAKDDALSANQLVRWVVTKEEHASRTMTTVSEYFLAQRVAPVGVDAEGRGAYLRKLADHHAVIVLAMKTKQNVDPKSVADLKAAIERISRYYEHEHEGAEEHAAGHDEMQREVSAEEHAEGHAGAHAEGHAEGHAEEHEH